MGILMKNGVSYSAPYAGYTKTLKEKLVAGETSVTFVDNCITDNVMVDWEVSKFGLVPTDKIEGNHSLTFVFPAQQEDVWVKATFSALPSSSEEEEEEEYFLVATGQQFIRLPVYVCQGLRIEFDAYFESVGVQQALISTNAWTGSEFLIHTSSASSFYFFPYGKTVNFRPMHTNHIVITSNNMKIGSSISKNTYVSKQGQIYLFGLTGGHCIRGMFGEMKIYVDNELIMDLIPTKKNNQVCYYDLISKVPYFSQTNTPFQLTKRKKQEFTPTLFTTGAAKLNLSNIYSQLGYSGVTVNNQSQKVEVDLYLSTEHLADSARSDYFGSSSLRNNNYDDTSIAKLDNSGILTLLPTREGTFTYPVQSNSWYTISRKYNQVIINDTPISVPSVYNDGIGLANSRSAATTYFGYGGVRLYYNNNLIANLVPKQTSSVDTGIFHDTISGLDFASIGSAQFEYSLV